MPKRRFRRHHLQLVPEQRAVPGKNIKNKKKKAYAPPPTPPIKGSATGALTTTKSGLGSKGSPFASREAAYSAGYKKTDRVYYRWGSKLYRILK